MMTCGCGDLGEGEVRLSASFPTGAGVYLMVARARNIRCARETREKGFVRYATLATPSGCFPLLRFHAKHLETLHLIRDVQPWFRTFLEVADE